MAVHEHGLLHQFTLAGAIRVNNIRKCVSYVYTH